MAGWIERNSASLLRLCPFHLLLPEYCFFTPFSTSLNEMEEDVSVFGNDKVKEKYITDLHVESRYLFYFIKIKIVQ